MKHTESQLEQDFISLLETDVESVNKLILVTNFH
jgi:hypothetical protein